MIERIGRKLWRWGLAWRFRLFHQHRYRTLILEYVNERPFLVLPDVFNPALFRTSGFFVSQFTDHIPAGLSVLDMGTGTGIGAVFAAQYAGHVTAVDINPEAVRTAQINVLLNHMEACIEVRQSDLFTNLHGCQFDVILFNPPYFRGDPDDQHDYAWRSNDTVERFSTELYHHLTPGGYALVVLSSDGDHDTFLQRFAANQLQVQAIARRDLINEILTVYKLTVPA